MWEKMKLQHKYNKVLFVLLEKMLNDDFFKGKIHMNMSKDPPSNEFNRVLEEWISMSTDANPQIGLVCFESHLGSIHSWNSIALRMLWTTFQGMSIS
jgi:hypothetical protein